MKAFTLRLGLLLVAVFLGCSGGIQEPRVAGLRSDALSSNRARKITILHVNDSHSTLDAVGPKDANLDGTLGGMTKAATLIERVRKSAPDALLLHAGDVFEGDLFFNLGYGAGGIAELSLMKQLKFDALTIGNHELDFGTDLLAYELGLAELGSLDVLSANLLTTESPPPLLASFFKKHTVKTVGGVRVGIFGLTTPNDPMMQPKPFTVAGGTDEDSFTQLLDIAAAEVAALRDPGLEGGAADVVVLLSHLGSEPDRELAQKLPASSGGIDVIIGGHDEVEVTFEAFVPGQTMVVQAGRFYEKVGKLDLIFQKGRILDAKHALLPVDATVKRQPEVNAVVQVLKKEIVGQFGDVFHTPVAFAPADLEKTWDPATDRRDTGVGDLAADALRTELEADIGLTTLGFLNDKIWAGPVVADDLFRALPYGVNLPAFPLLDGADPVLGGIFIDPVGKYLFTGPQLYAGFEFAISVGEIPQVSGNVQVGYNPSKSPALQYLVLDGTPIDPTATCAGEPCTYSVATNIFVVSAVNQALHLAELGQIAVPPPDPAVNQLSVLLEYATGRELLTPSEARVRELTPTGL